MINRLVCSEKPCRTAILSRVFFLPSLGAHFPFVFFDRFRPPPHTSFTTIVRLRKPTGAVPSPKRSNADAQSCADVLNRHIIAVVHHVLSLALVSVVRQAILVTTSLYCVIYCIIRKSLCGNRLHEKWPNLSHVICTFHHVIRLCILR